jgi:hypothetical protein
LLSSIAVSAPTSGVQKEKRAMKGVLMLSEKPCVYEPVNKKTE